MEQRTSVPSLARPSLLENYQQLIGPRATDRLLKKARQLAA